MPDMQRRNFLKWSSLVGLASSLPFTRIGAADKDIDNAPGGTAGDRAYWVALLDKIATPVLSNMSKGQLRKNMPVEY
ncbi:hypothetical protein ABTO78_21435, partial [Acinetobacter baumannii]